MKPEQPEAEPELRPELATVLEGSGDERVVLIAAENDKDDWRKRKEKVKVGNGISSGTLSSSVTKLGSGGLESAFSLSNSSSSNGVGSANGAASANNTSANGTASATGTASANGNASNSAPGKNNTPTSLPPRKNTSPGVWNTPKAKTLHSLSAAAAAPQTPSSMAVEPAEYTRSLRNKRSILEGSLPAPPSAPPTDDETRSIALSIKRARQKPLLKKIASSRADIFEAQVEDALDLAHSDGNETYVYESRGHTRDNSANTLELVPPEGISQSSAPPLRSVDVREDREDREELPAVSDRVEEHPDGHSKPSRFQYNFDNTLDLEMEYGADDLARRFTRYKGGSGRGQETHVLGSATETTKDGGFSRALSILNFESQTTPKYKPRRVVLPVAYAGLYRRYLNRSGRYDRELGDFFEDTPKKGKSPGRYPFRTTISKLFDPQGTNLKRYLGVQDDFNADDIEDENDDGLDYFGYDLEDGSEINETTPLNLEYYNSYRGPKLRNMGLLEEAKMQAYRHARHMSHNNDVPYGVYYGGVNKRRRRTWAQSAQLMLWGVVMMILFLVIGFMLGFFLALTKDLVDVSVETINHLLVSPEELIFDIECSGINPGFGSVSVTDVDLDLFVKTRYLDDDDGDDDDYNRLFNYQTFFIGNIQTLEYPLVFPNSLFDKKEVLATSSIRLIEPGKNASDPTYNDGLRDTVGALTLREQKWKTAIKYPFELIMRGKFNYKLPFSGAPRVIAVHKSVSVQIDDYE